MRVALIGSGITAVGALLALQRLPGLQLDHYVGDENDTGKDWRYENGQIASSIQPGGLSSFWHGVIPVAPEFSLDEDFKYVFQKFYGAIVQPADLFIPFRPIRGVTICRKLIDSLNLKKHRVRSTADLEAIMLQTAEGETSGEFSQYDLIILAVGELQLSELLYSRGVKHEVFDHICGFVGKSHVSKFDNPLEVRYTRSGHFRQCLKADETTIFTGRPATSVLEPKGKVSEINYGLSKKEVIKQLLKRGSLSKISEAIFNRFGILLSSYENLSVHYQKTIPVELDYSKRLVSIPREEQLLQTIFSDFERQLGPLETQADLNFYPGTHVRVKLDFDFPSKVINPFMCRDAVSSPYHHSFRKLVVVYQRVKKSLEEW